MKYYIKRILEGSFPGNPDVDYVKITESEWREIHKKFIGRWKDTKEQTEAEAEADMNISQYSDDELVNEVKRRGIEISVHISSVEVEIKLNGIDMGNAICEERHEIK